MIVPVPSDVPPAERLGHVHLVGVGGAALSGMARMMAARGIVVSGSDAQPSAALDSLAALGVRVHVGHAAGQVAGADVVVVSTAVRDDNPEVVEARRLGLPVWPRAAAMASLMAGHDAVVVTGTHGKTTTTGMLVTALQACGADPSYTVGSTLLASGLNAGVGAGRLFIAEGDESDAAILAYTPWGIAVTNVEADHLDFFGTAEAYASVFDDFVERLRPGGFVVCGVDDVGGRRLSDVSRERGLRTTTVGHAESSDVRLVGAADGGGAQAAVDVVRGGEVLGTLRLAMPGSAYALDAGVALAAGLECGEPLDRLAEGLSAYRGTGRRMELKGEASGIRVYDSYAHHPSEIRADLTAARVLAGDSRLVVCFQPHLYSRTQLFAGRMGVALAIADVVLVLDVYPAREQPVPGVTGELVAREVPLKPSAVHYVGPLADAPGALAGLVQGGDLVLTLGAGDVTRVGPLLLQELAARAGAMKEAP